MTVKVISNFLEIEKADELLREIYKTPGEWWAKAVSVSNNSAKYLNLTRVPDILCFESLGFSESLLNDALTYRFTRSTPHYENCKCYECNFRKNIIMKDIKETIEQEFLYADSNLEECFISLYYAGDFLGSHTDAKKGIAFIYHLSKKWKVEYGGLLNIINSDNKTYTAICPEYNSLVLMDVSTVYGRSHFVSEVSNLAPYPRVAISGWFSQK